MLFVYQHLHYSNTLSIGFYFQTPWGVSYYVTSAVLPALSQRNLYTGPLALSVDCEGSVLAMFAIMFVAVLVIFFVIFLRFYWLFFFINSRMFSAEFKLSCCSGS